VSTVRVQYEYSILYAIPVGDMAVVTSSRFMIWEVRMTCEEEER
jgi:hypothetical protein